MNLKGNFTQIRPIYEIPEDDLVDEILIPAMSFCDEVRIETGFFSSNCFAQIAPGMAHFINHSTGTMKLLASPRISEDDLDAVSRGTKDPENAVIDAVEKLFENAKLSSSAIERHTVDTLCYLLASGRLKMRFVFMQRGMYHKKNWMFKLEGNWLVVHGSSNATRSGLLVNGEQMSVDYSWAEDVVSIERISILLERWEKAWGNKNTWSETYQIEHALEEISKLSHLKPPTNNEFVEAWQADYEAGIEPFQPNDPVLSQDNRRLVVPDWLEWNRGRYAHQKRAVESVLDHSGGIVSIATGGGKTKTALIAATEIQNMADEHYCFVVVVPSVPLLLQWKKEIEDFNGTAVLLSGKGVNKFKRQKELDRLNVAFRTKLFRSEVLLLTINLFLKLDNFQIWLKSLPSKVNLVLIADEVHQLGVKKFIENPPTWFRYRIGLSATPVRQFDPDGTDILFKYFGGQPVFEFTLKEAIQSECLVPYHYFPHIVELTEEEMDKYEELTKKLARTGFSVEDDGKTVGLTKIVKNLLFKRRAVVEQATGKIEALKKILTEIGPSQVKKTLIYTSAKANVVVNKRQINSVNELLGKMNIRFHQLTNEETSSNQSQSLLDLFDSGLYQTLTSMKVLDEGLNIPNVDTAFLLASSTVEREWVQRRGRILRNAPGKQRATLHDFIVIPANNKYKHGSSLLYSELRRAKSFSNSANNQFDKNGPQPVIERLESLLSVLP